MATSIDSSPLTNTNGSALEGVHEAGSVLNPSGAVGAQASTAFRGDGGAVVAELGEFSKSRQFGVQPVRTAASSGTSKAAHRPDRDMTSSSPVGRLSYGPDGVEELHHTRTADDVIAVAEQSTAERHRLPRWCEGINAVDSNHRRTGEAGPLGVNAILDAAKVNVDAGVACGLQRYGEANGDDLPVRTAIDVEQLDMRCGHAPNASHSHTGAREMAYLDSSGRGRVEPRRGRRILRRGSARLSPMRT